MISSSVQKLRTVRDRKLASQVVLLRVDFNVPIASDGQILDGTRIIKSKLTIDYLLNSGAKIILLSHLGGQGLSFKTLLKQIVELLGIDVKLIEPFAAKSAIKVELEQNKVVLLDNLRLISAEVENDAGFASKLAELGDVYVNDAFSCMHRKHASIVAITEFLPSYAGFLVEEELKHLNLLFDPNCRPITAIIGGKKLATKMPILKFLVDKVDFLAIGGAMVPHFWSAEKNKLDSGLSPLVEMASLLSHHGDKLIVPSDAVGQTDKGQMLFLTKDRDHDAPVLDIGSEAVLKICAALNRSKMVIWNGPVGLFEHPGFAISTQFLIRYIAEKTRLGRLVSILGGGDTIAAINKIGCIDHISHVSTAGGAFLAWISGEKMPGLVPLLL